MQQENGLASRPAAGVDRPARLLVANDQELWIWSLETILAPDGFSVIRATSGAQVVEQVQIHDPDVVILHSTLRDTSGLELCRHLRERRLISASTPILMTTSGPARRSDRLRALRAGGWDYASLPIDGEELIAKLRVFLAGRRSAGPSAPEGLVEPTSGLYDIRGIVARVRELGLAARRHGRALGCATVALGAEPISMDRISFGLRVEGRIPRESRRASELLRAVVRGSDIIGQMAPNEYVVLAPETELSGVQQLAQRIVEAFGGGPVAMGGPPPVRVGCYAVSDLSATLIDPIELIVRSTKALRMTQLPGTPAIQSFGEELA